ncbi:uncharacterized protein [Hyperolius riggenbachi]|uniref:uncharacterized protein n=1 Tax=Hyperolius riggenbachi TaxID=752182 RepID=UPI0035A34C7B
MSPKSDDGSSPLVGLSTDVPLFGRNRTSLYVDNNGLLSFRSTISQYVPQALPQAFGNPFLALFWSDINNQVAGDIFYRQSTDPDLLSRATSDIHAYFHNVTFTAHWAFVATWHRVAYYGSNTNKVNTFQAVLSTDGNQTFLLYNYADIQWPSVANGSIQEGRTALAGLNSGFNSGYYTIPGSMTPSIRNISSTSNVNVPGRWAFKMDQLHPEDIAGNIDNSTDVLLETTIAPIYRTSTPAPVLYSSDLLYPYGPLIDAVSPTSDDGGTPLIPLSTSLHLFGRNYSSLYVNNNGLLSFRSSISQFTPQQLPVALGNPFLAVFWADINNQVAGDIYYRQSTDPDLLHQVSSDIRTYFHDEDFTAQWVFVATWHRVAYFGSNTNKVDTFQAVVTTDGNQTFLFYNYADLQWPSMREDGSRYDGPLTLAGINSGFNTGYYTLPGSLSHDIRNVSSTSNVNVTGRWVFKVGNLHPEDINGALGNDAEVLTTETPLSTTTHPEISTDPIYIQSRTTVAPSPVLRSSDLLYPYGTSVDTMSPKSDDGSSPLVGLSTDVPLFGRNRTSLYVDNNGLLSFRSAISQYVPQALPQAFGNPFLALFWSDINNQVAGDIFYRQSTDPDLLSRATSDIQAYFHNVTFTAHWVFVATWHRVAYYGSNTNKVNTFQAVLSTDGNQTFLLYNYADIQWPSVANGSIQEGRTALAGLNSGFNSGYYTIPGSMTPSIRNISSTSNVNVPGRWAFKVDQLHPEDVTGNIDNSTDVLLETTSAPIYTIYSQTTPAPVLYSSDLLYPYGPLIDAVSPKSDDGGTPLIPLSTSLHLFGRNYSSLYVNNNGLLSLRSNIGQFTPQQLPVAFGNPFLAVFWADINNQVAGDIYYRQSTDPDLLHQVSSDITTYFHDEDFTAQWVFVATWHRVAYFGSSTNKVDTFQAVVSTDGNQTFLLYNYADLQWPSRQGNGSRYDGPVALAGINSGYNTGYYTLPGSLSLNIRNLSSTSNVNVTGRWVFKVDNLHPEDINGALGNDTEVFTTASPLIDLSTVHSGIATDSIYNQNRTTIAPPFLISSDLLYPYGSSLDTTSPKSDDGYSPLIYLSTNVPVFDRNHSFLYVDNNGLLSFHEGISQYVPQALPQAFGNPFFAPFWSDINNQVAGDIFYRQSTDPELLSRATSDIHAYFHNVDFTAQWAFVATWHRVAYFGSNTNKVNTFQAVLSTDGNQTFLLYNYADIQWPSVANGSIQEGRAALAGLNSGYDTGYYTIPGSLSPAMVNISSTSNVNVTGRWAFKVDQLHPEDVNDLLYPYGSAIDASSPKSDDGSSPIIYLSSDVPLFGSNHSFLFVDNNGLLSFQSAIWQFTPQPLPAAFGNSFLAPFWSDINNQLAGDIYYRQSTDPNLLSRATSDIQTYFHNEDFVARWVFVATWHRVAYFGSTTGKVNTFQAVLSTDGNQTFLLYNYADIQWPSVSNGSVFQGGPQALAGLNSGFDTGYYTIPGSLSPAIANLSSTSNVNVTGRWAFRVDRLHPEDVTGNIGLPSLRFICRK